MAEQMRRGQTGAQPANSTQRRWAALKQVIQLLHHERHSLQELLSRLVQLLPNAFQQPDMVRVRIALDGQTFSSSDFQVTPWMRQIPIIAPDCHQGTIELAYRSDSASESSDGSQAAPAEQDEMAFLEVIVELLKGYLGRRVEKAARSVERADRQRLEQQLRQAQKMEVVGRLAGGVAHDFNNLLTVISGYSEILLENMTSDDPAREIVKEIYRSGERASLLTQQLLAFSRKQVLEPKVLNLNDVVSESSRMLARLIGEDIRLRTVLSEELHLIRVDPGQLEQVIMNLAVNSRDAMPNGGQLTIETANVEIDERYAYSHWEIRSGTYVMLAVSDTGHGMDDATRARIFEPFFSTKPSDRGTGLGLATVYGIVKQSGGNIGVYSEPNYGTVIKVYFPVVEKSSTNLDLPVEIPTALEGSETILMVEDDAAVRSLARLALQMYGYQVLEASDGREALALSQRHKGSIHLLVTDVVMPGINGRELAEQLTRKFRDLQVLFLSGYTSDTIVHHGVLEADMAFLQKPFTPVLLSRKVREVLNARRR